MNIRLLITGLTIVATLPLLTVDSFAQSTSPSTGAFSKYGCQFHATEYYRIQADLELSQSASEFLGLIQKSESLERQLIQTEFTNENWSPDQADLLLDLARTRLALGDNAGARRLYEDALLNIRVNTGIYAMAQIPIILELLNSYMVVDTDFTDRLGDRALFLMEKAYAEERDIPKLISGLNNLLNIRLSAEGTREVPATVAAPPEADVVFTSQKAESPHLTKARDLGARIIELSSRIDRIEDDQLREQVMQDMDFVAQRGDSFFTGYDDLGRALETAAAGVDQPSTNTGAVLRQVQHLLRSDANEADEANESIIQAKQLLDQLFSQYETLTDIDKAAALDFRSDYHLTVNDIPAAIRANEDLLEINVLRPDYQLRALHTLGQLYEDQQRWQESIETYNCWRQLSTVEDPRVYLGLAHDYQMIGEINIAIRHLLWYIAAVEGDGEVVEQRQYLALRDMLYQVNDLQSAKSIEDLLARRGYELQE